MRIVTIIGNITDNNEVKLSSNNNLEIIEYKIDGTKVKSFGKVANTAKDLIGLVVGNGTITDRDMTTKDGRNYVLQEIVINKIDSLKQKEVDNFDIKPEDFAPGKSEIPAPKQMEFDEEELPFY